jgi:AraC-like DNA-binding protein
MAKSWEFVRACHLIVDDPVPGQDQPGFLAEVRALDAAYDKRVQHLLPGHLLWCCSLTNGGRLDEPSRTTVLSPGEAFWWEIGDPSANYRYDPNHRGDWRLLGLIFHGEAALVRIRGLISQRGRIHHIDPDGVVLNTVRSFLPRPGQRPCLRRLAADQAQHLVDLVITAALAPPPTSDAVDDLVRRTERIMQQRLAEPLNMADLAKAVGVSREHLTRTMVANGGKGPAERLRHLRLDRAEELLLQESLLDLPAIAAAVGLTQATLKRNFHQRHGVGLERWRRVLIGL